jgi:hypothetical protein
MAIRVVLEVAPKKSFASALDWPGWSRGAKTPDEALEALVAYAPRYASVAKRARIPFDPPASSGDLEVVERLKGSGGTEFGVPGTPAAAEEDALRAADTDRLVTLLKAAWGAFDASARAAVGVELSKGPRGGGRDLDKIIGHVREAEVAYLGQLGSRSPDSSAEAPERPMAQLRRTYVTALRAVAAGDPVADTRNTKRPWSPRYAVRRSAWHALDHAWEIEDRSTR